LNGWAEIGSGDSLPQRASRKSEAHALMCMGFLDCNPGLPGRSIRRLAGKWRYSVISRNNFGKTAIESLVAQLLLQTPPGLLRSAGQFQISTFCENSQRKDDFPASPAVIPTT
jgi:hypothetical protein